MSDIILKRQVSAVDLYNGKNVSPLLEEIKKEVRSRVIDATTKAGQKEGRSLAAKVAKTKTYLDTLGKELVSEQKQAIKLVDSERKKLRDELDSLKGEVLKPIIKEEQAEDDRIQRHKDAIKVIRKFKDGADANPIGFEVKRIEKALENLDAAFKREWDEFKEVATDAYNEAVTSLDAAIEARMKHDADQRELKQLREEKEKREKEEARVGILRSGIDKMRKFETGALGITTAEVLDRIKNLDSHYKKYDWEELTEEASYVYNAVKESLLMTHNSKKESALREQKAAEERAAKEAEEKANRDAEEAEKRRKSEEQEQAERIKQAEESAAKRERERIVEEAKKEKAEQERKALKAKEEADRRLADDNHKAKVRKEAVEALVETGSVLSREEAVRICLTIENREIPHVSINF